MWYKSTLKQIFHLLLLWCPWCSPLSNTLLLSVNEFAPTVFRRQGCRCPCCPRCSPLFRIFLTFTLNIYYLRPLMMHQDYLCIEFLYTYRGKYQIRSIWVCGLGVLLPISTLRSTFKIAKLYDSIENITFTLRVFQVKKFNITIVDRVQKVF